MEWKRRCDDGATAIGEFVRPASHRLWEIGDFDGRGWDTNSQQRCPHAPLHVSISSITHTSIFSLDFTHPPYSTNHVVAHFRYIRSRPNKRRNSLRARPPPMRRDDPHYPGNDRRYEDLSEGQIPLTESLLDCMERGACFFSLFWGCTHHCRVDRKLNPYLVVDSPRRILLILAYSSSGYHVVSLLSFDDIQLVRCGNTASGKRSRRETTS